MLGLLPRDAQKLLTSRKIVLIGNSFSIYTHTVHIGFILFASGNIDENLAQFLFRQIVRKFVLLAQFPNTTKNVKSFV